MALERRYEAQAPGIENSSTAVKNNLNSFSMPGLGDASEVLHAIKDSFFSPTWIQTLLTFIDLSITVLSYLN